MHDIFKDDKEERINNAEPRLGDFGWSDRCCWIFEGTIWIRFYDPDISLRPQRIQNKQGDLYAKNN